MKKAGTSLSFFFFFFSVILKKLFSTGISLVVQWLRICLPVLETRVPSPVWEDPTCLSATKPSELLNY